MAKVRWTAEAQQWLKTIHDYIARDKPQAAIRTVRALHQKVDMLAKFPELGYRYEELENREVRILLYGHYRIAYSIEADGVIAVLGIFHSALDDINKYLK